MATSSASGARPAKPKNSWRLWISILAVVAVWAGCTKLFWVGYVGTDDFFYSRYAFLFHRRPINWWEGRMPAILAIRTAFHWLGPTEFAAALPTLLASLMVVGSVAWFVGWPKSLRWQATASVLLAATLPFDVVSRTVPGASFMATGLLIFGSVCILKGPLSASILGSACFSLAFSTHELSCFYIAIFLGAAFVFDRGRFLKPLLLSAVFLLGAVAVEAAFYGIRYGDPLLRFHLALGGSTHFGLYDPDTHLAGFRFLLWPLQTLFFSKVFGPDLLILLCAGIVVWRKLETDHRILLVSGLSTWFYLGYGSKVPWDYVPLARLYHFYGPLELSVSVLLPVCLSHLFSSSARAVLYAAGSCAALIVVNLLCSAAGGRYGQEVAVSKELLHYATDHPASTFVTDVATMNALYVLSGFTIPPNVICINGAAVQHDLLVNKEPPGTPRLLFQERHADGILLNLNQLETGVSPEFLAYMDSHMGLHERLAPVRYRLLLEPLPASIKKRAFALKSLGGELIMLR